MKVFSIAEGSQSGGAIKASSHQGSSSRPESSSATFVLTSYMIVEITYGKTKVGYKKAAIVVGSQLRGSK